MEQMSRIIPSDSASVVDRASLCCTSNNYRLRQGYRMMISERTFALIAMTDVAVSENIRLAYLN